MKIRQANLADQDWLYKICILTGESGSDATGIFDKPQLLGDIWVGPYLHLSLQYCFVLEASDRKILGYCLATLDTTSFERAASTNWWPAKQKIYKEPDTEMQNSWSRDEKLENIIHNPLTTPVEILEEFPSHAHINLIPEAQGQGWGRSLMETMENSLRIDRSPGVHLILSSKNLNALAFYKALGYQIIFEKPEEIGVAKSL